MLVILYRNARSRRATENFCPLVNIMASTAQPDSKTLMNDYLALRSGDESKIDILADSFVFTHPMGQTTGIEEFLESQRETEGALVGGGIEVLDLLVGDDFAMWEWRLTGTHEEEWQGIAPTGRSIDLTGMSKTVFENGRVAANTVYFDSATLLKQLGLESPP